MCRCRYLPTARGGGKSARNTNSVSLEPDLHPDIWKTHALNSNGMAGGNAEASIRNKNRAVWQRSGRPGRMWTSFDVGGGRLSIVRVEGDPGGVWFAVGFCVMTAVQERRDMRDS